MFTDPNLHRIFGRHLVNQCIIIINKAKTMSNPEDYFGYENIKNSTVMAKLQSLNDSKFSNLEFTNIGKTFLKFLETYEVTYLKELAQLLSPAHPQDFYQFLQGLFPTNLNMGNKKLITVLTDTTDSNQAKNSRFMYFSRH